MSLPTVPLLQRQLETALQLIISLSPTMTTDEIMMIRIRLTEANIFLGNVLVEQNGTTPNGKVNPIQPFSLTQFSAADNLAHRPTESAPSTATASRNNSATDSNSGNRGSLRRVSASRSSARQSAASENSARRAAVRRPTTRSSTRHNSTIRSLLHMGPVRNTLVPLIEMDTDESD